MPPCEMFRMRRTPKISVNPTDSRNRMAANTKPSTMMMVSVAIGALSLFDLLWRDCVGAGRSPSLERLQPFCRLNPYRWHNLLCRQLHHPLHNREAVLGVHLTQSDNAGMYGLMVGPHGHRTEWRFPGQAFKGFNDLIGFGPAPRLVHGFLVSRSQPCKSLIGAVRHVVGVAAKARLIGLHKLLLAGMGLRVGMQEIPGSGAGHGNDALGRLSFQILEGLL